MNKTELINSLSEETALPKKDVLRLVDSMIRIIERSLRKGDRVSLTGFGAWSTSVRPARKGINPANKQRIDIPAVRVTKFKAGKNLREMVRSV